MLELAAMRGRVSHGIMGKILFPQFQVPPATKFRYDLKILHRKIQIFCIIFSGPPRSLKFSYLTVKYAIRYHTSATPFTLNVVSLEVCLAQKKALKVYFLSAILF